MDRRAIHVALVVCVLLSGCSILGGGETVRQEQAVAALADARETANDTDTYRYEADVEVVATAEGNTERVQAALTSRVSVPDRRMAMTTAIQGQTLESYVVNGTGYQECARMAPSWGVTNVSAEDWRSLTPLDRQLSLLATGSLYHNGTESVNGREAVLLVGEPTSEAITQYQDRRSGRITGDASLENLRLRAWIDRDTGRLLQTKLRFEVNEGDATATAEMTSQFRAYGEPVSSTVPAEATDRDVTMPCPGS